MVLNSFNFEKEKEFSKNDLIGFWDKVSKKYVKWDKIYDKAYNGNEIKPEWFKGGELNICNNVLDIHIKDRNKRNSIAIISECPLKGITKKITFYELWNQVCLFSRALKNLGVEKGDHVIIYMPTYIHSHIAFLSCARIGAIHCAVYGGVSSLNLSLRIDHLKPKLLITSNYSVKGNDIIEYHPLVSNALKLTKHIPKLVISHNRDEEFNIGGEISPTLQNNIINDIIPNLLDWKELIKNIEPFDEYTLVDSTHPLLLAYTSGTTGSPKCIEIESGGFISQILYNYKNIMGVKDGDIFLSTSDSGWSLGQLHMYGLLGNGITSIIYEGDVTIPRIDSIFKIIETHKVNRLLTAPTEIRLIKKSDLTEEFLKHFDISSLKFTYLTGEILDLSTYEYSKMIFKNSSLLNIYGQSEACCGFIINEINPSKPKAIGIPNPGYNIKFLDSNCQEITKPGEIGEMVLKLPLPSGYCYYCLGDLGYFDEENCISIISRVDNIANICCERVNTVQCEEIIIKNIQYISDCVVVPINDELYGQRLIGFVQFRDDFYQKQQQQENIQIVHDEINFF